MTDDPRPKGPPDPEDGGGPDVANDEVTDPGSETAPGTEPEEGKDTT